jgi:hypothetical protein
MYPDEASSWHVFATILLLNGLCRKPAIVVQVIQSFASRQISRHVNLCGSLFAANICVYLSVLVRVRILVLIGVMLRLVSHCPSREGSSVITE